MTESTDNLQICPECQATMDVSGLEPLTQVACPACGAAVVASPMIAHYELLEIVGRGGMGVVYKARDTSLDRLVALKVLRKDHSEDAQLVAQLETEAAITASINHPYVVRVFTTGTDLGRFYIAMELVDKGTLDDLISLQGQVAEAQVLEIGSQIAQGLRAAYQHGLIHRDVKPGNILFADSHTAKIVDFGLAMLEAAASGGGEIWGTPYYVAPEKLDQKPEDFRSDMYSLGATLFHALAGRPPFEAEDATMVALKHLKSQAVSLQAFAPHISGSTAYVINRTLLKDPNQRYSSYDEFIEHLEYARAELEKKGATPQAKQRLVLETEDEQKIWSYVTFGMLGLVAIVGAGALWYFNSRGEEKTVAQDTAPASTALTFAGAADKAQAKQFESARQALLEGKTEEAAKTFQDLGSNPETAAPIAQWSLAHAGLAELLAGRPREARAAFASLQNREIPAAAASDPKLASFFRELASLMISEQPVPASALKDFSRDNYGAFAPLAAGLKNWHLGEFDTAGTLLRQYQTTSPRAEFSWLADYKSVVSDYLADFTEYRGAIELVKMAKTRTQRHNAIESLTAMENALRTKGTLATRFETLKDELKQRSEEGQTEQEKKFTEELKSLDAVRSRIAEQSRAWKFTEARQSLRDLPLIGDLAQRQRRVLLRKLDTLIDWKATLIGDLPRAGGRITLRKKDGAELKGRIIKANDSGVEIQGSGTIAWSALSPESLLAAAAASAPSNLPPYMAAQRSWQAGVFAAMSGLAADAEKLLTTAARVRPEYVSDLPLYLFSARPGQENFARSATATASDFVHTDRIDERPQKAFDDALKTKWCAKDSGPKWLQLDLGKSKVINNWVVHHASAGGEEAWMNTADFELQVSQDGQTWETVDKVMGNTAAVTDRLIVPTSARYVRLSLTTPTQKPQDRTARIREIELRGPSPAGSNDLAAAFFQPSEWFPNPQLTSHDVQTEQNGATNINRKSGEIAVTGAGTDIWAQADAFQFGFQTLEGDGEIVARVTELENKHEWSKAGLMFRESLNPNSRNVLLGTTAAEKVTLQHRPEPGVDSLSVAQPASPLPIWLKLVRRGDTFIGYVSQDGADWKEYRSVTLPMGAKLYTGLAVTSHNSPVLCTAIFDYVTIRQTSSSDPGSTTGVGGGSPQAGAQRPATASVP